MRSWEPEECESELSILKYSQLKFSNCINLIFLGLYGSYFKDNYRLFHKTKFTKWKYRVNHIESNQHLFFTKFWLRCCWSGPDVGTSIFFMQCTIKKLLNAIIKYFQKRRNILKNLFLCELMKQRWKNVNNFVQDIQTFYLLIHLSTQELKRFLTMKIFFFAVGRFLYHNNDADKLHICITDFRKCFNDAWEGTYELM